jgi:hypothetical protein
MLLLNTNINGKAPLAVGNAQHLLKKFTKMNNFASRESKIESPNNSAIVSPSKSAINLHINKSGPTKATDEKLNTSVSTVGLGMSKRQQKDRELALFAANMVKKRNTVNDRLENMNNFHLVNKIKWDIESPKFQQACKLLGFLPEETKLLPPDEFIRGSKDR